MKYETPYLNRVESLYLHFPYCTHLCNYCDFFKYKLEDRSAINEFEQKLAHNFIELTQLHQQHDKSFGELKTLYFGGGTPSLWGKRGIDFMDKQLELHQMQLSSDAEVTLEVDPNTLAEFADLKRWREFGVNRISVGAQAFDDNWLKVADRHHNLKDIAELLDEALKVFDNVSVDLLLGLPDLGLRNLIAEIDWVNRWPITHMSLYILKTRKNYQHFTSLPDADQLAGEYELANSTLKNLGFNHYEVSNYSRDGKESVHNQRYWDYFEVAALGPSAAGLLHSQQGALRYRKRWQKVGFEQERLDLEQVQLERLYLGLRCDRGIGLGDFFSKAQFNELESLIDLWQQEGWVDSYKNKQLRLNSLGWLRLDSLIESLFKFL